MDLCDIMLLGCGVDDYLLEDIFDTIAFIEEDTNGDQEQDGPEPLSGNDEVGN